LGLETRVTRRELLAALVAATAAGCRSPDPQQVLRVDDMEAYWAIDSAQGALQYLAPAIRFRVTNTGGKPLRSVQASASFRRQGEEWGSAFEYTATPKQPLGPGESRWVALRSDGRYSTLDPPAMMFQNAEFKDATADVYLKVAASPPVKFASTPIERRIGSRTVQEFSDAGSRPGGPPAPPPSR
jgi:hypothetical protein